MASQTPEIGVRLSASGVNDVIQAFARVRQEGVAAGKQTTSSFASLNTQLKSLSDLIPAVTAGLVVTSAVQG